MMSSFLIACVSAVLAVQPAAAPNLPAQFQPQPGSAPVPGAERAPARPVKPPAEKPGKYVAVAGEEPVGSGAWKRYFTTDRFGRLITFYAAVPAGEGPQLPVVVFVQGSGSQSVFMSVETPAGPRLAGAGGHEPARRAAKGRAIVVVVEKPGVGFCEQVSRPGSAEEAGAEFRHEHTLERWSEAVTAALWAARTLPRANPAKVLVSGHSEGGIVASKVAADEPTVTHVGVLAGDGPTQLFGLLQAARSGQLCGGMAQGDECVRRILEQWQAVLRDPMSPDKMFLSHPHRRWSTFLASSPAEELRKSKARVFIAQGTADQAVPAITAEVLHASLLAQGRDVTYLKLDGADHTFAMPGDQTGAGMLSVFERMLDWFLAA
jgi:dienelactone hydrolase